MAEVEFELLWQRREGRGVERVGGEAIKAAFLANLAQAESDLASQDAAIQRTVAYYMTLCDVGSRNFVRDMVYNTWAVILDNDYRSAVSHLLSPYGNTDSDGQFNIEEWQESGYDVEAYLARTLDDERTPDVTLLDPEAETFVETCDYCTKTEIVFGGGSTAGSFTSGYEPDYELIVMIDGKLVEEETEVALGRWIDIVVQPTGGTLYGQGYQFDHWSAPGNLLNGERSERARFMLMPAPYPATSTAIGPVFHRNRVKLPSDFSGVTYSFDPGDTVVDISSEVNPATGFKEFAGHRGSTVTMSVASIYNWDCGQHDPEHIQQHIGWNLAGLVTEAPNESIEVLLPWETLQYYPGAVIHCDSLAYVPPANTRTITATAAQGIPAAIGPSNCAGAVGSVVLDAMVLAAMGTFWPQPGYETDPTRIAQSLPSGGSIVTTVTQEDPPGEEDRQPARWGVTYYTGGINAQAAGGKREEYKLTLDATTEKGTPHHPLAHFSTSPMSPGTDDTFAGGTNVAISATPLCAFNFSHWLLGGTVVTPSLVDGVNVISLNYNNITVAMTKARDLVAVLDLDVFFYKPNGSPQNDNHFVFNDATPGVCVVTIDTDLTCPGEWKIEEIEGDDCSVATVISQDGSSVTFTYTGLPSKNSEFGKKKVYLNGVEVAEVVIFYDPNASNHPSISQAEGEQWCDQWPIKPGMPSIGIPNWFYYWRQTEAYYPGVRASYDRGTSCKYLTIQDVQQWYPLYNINALPGTEPYKLFGFTSLSGELWPPIDFSASAIDNFALTCRHEAGHAEEWNGEDGWFPNGDEDVDSLSQNDQPNRDFVPDALEMWPENMRQTGANLDFDQTMELTYPNPFLYQNDAEEHNQRCNLWKDYQHFRPHLYWKLGDADEKDWSKYGNQWNR